MVVCFVLQVHVFAGKHPKVGVCLFCGVGLLDTENGLPTDVEHTYGHVVAHRNWWWLGWKRWPPTVT